MVFYDESVLSYVQTRGGGFFFQSYLHISSSKWVLVGTQIKAKKLFFHIM